MTEVAIQHDLTVEYVERLRARFFARVVSVGDCLIWSGPSASNTYGQISVGTGPSKRPEPAHRVAWFLHYGYWPSTIDHFVCKDHLCVAISHLEDTTQQVNMLRGDHPSARAVRTDTCKRNHVGQWRTRPDGRRYCRACAAEKYRNGEWGRARASA